MADAPVLSATLSVSMKVNLGNYESADAFLSVSGITMETEIDDVTDLLDGPARISYDALKTRLAARVASLKRKEA